MSKIICDVCGTSYPETAAQCPICGCAKPEDAQVSDTDISGTEKTRSSTYTYVKGGRFSKANVRKRNKANQAAHGRREAARPEEDEDSGNNKSNRGLVITVIVLLLAIVAVVIYIAVQFFLPGKDTKQDNTPMPTGTTPVVTTAPTIAETTEPSYSCTDLIVSDSVVELDQMNAAYLLNVTPVPENTVDVVTYESSDSSVATVTAEGRVTAVAPGQAVITITCGEITKECRVVCMFETEPTEPPTEATTAPAASDEPFALNREDITMSHQGETWQLYDGPLSKLMIVWTSDNPNVATIEGGLVTAVGSGTTEVHGEYNGQIVTCIIRCSF